jgi:hypothetical protein
MLEGRLVGLPPIAVSAAWTRDLQDDPTEAYGR